MGYTAASIIHHLPDLKALLENPQSNNVLAQACQVYCNTNFIHVALCCLAWFTIKVTLPFLNMCELSSQSDLLQLLPQLKKDLEKGILETLSKFEVNYSFTIDKPSSDLERLILQKFSEKGAVDLTTQREIEYRFCEFEQNPHATDLTKLTKKQLDNLPTNNLQS